MKFLFKKGFEVFNSERYAVANPIVKRDYAETYRLTRRKDGRSFLMKVYLPDEMPEDLKFKGKPSLIAYLNSSGISRQLSIAAWGEFNSPEGKTFPYIITDYDKGDHRAWADKNETDKDSWSTALTFQYKF